MIHKDDMRSHDLTLMIDKTIAQFIERNPANDAVNTADIMCALTAVIAKTVFIAKVDIDKTLEYMRDVIIKFERANK